MGGRHAVPCTRVTMLHTVRPQSGCLQCDSGSASIHTSAQCKAWGELDGLMTAYGARFIRQACVVQLMERAPLFADPK